MGTGRRLATGPRLTTIPTRATDRATNRRPCRRVTRATARPHTANSTASSTSRRPIRGPPPRGRAHQPAAAGASPNRHRQRGMFHQPAEYRPSLSRRRRRRRHSSRRYGRPLRLRACGGLHQTTRRASHRHIRRSRRRYRPRRRFPGRHLQVRCVLRLPLAGWGRHHPWVAPRSPVRRPVVLLRRPLRSALVVAPPAGLGHRLAADCRLCRAHVR